MKTTTIPVALLLGLALFAACAAPTPGVDTGPARDLGPADVAPDQTASDAAPPDVVVADLPSPLPPTPLPIPVADTRQVGQVAGIDIFSAAVEETGESVWLVYEHFDQAFTSAQLYVTSAATTALPDFAEPQPIATAPVTGAPEVRATPSTVSLPGDDPWVYFVEAPATSAAVSLRRARLEQGALAQVEPVTASEPIGVLGWPKIVGLADGRLALAYRDGLSEIRLAGSEDGKSFGPAAKVGPPGAMPAVAGFGDGGLALTYQVGSGGQMVSYYRVLPDLGQQGSTAAVVTDSSGNVHDTAPVTRLDGDVDLYFIYPPGTHPGFALFRRCLTRAGKLGAEQQVVQTAFGNLAKPVPWRLGDGRLLLTFVEQSTGHLLHAAVLAGDAPCPTS